MIVLSAGMQKSGTGWYFNMTNDLLVAAGAHDVRAVRDKFKLDSTLRFYNCNIGDPTAGKMARVAVPHFMGYSFAVKSNGRPTRSLRLALAARIAKATYMQRDPRDVVLSVFETGQKMRDTGKFHSFGKLTDMEAAFRHVNGLLKTWQAWQGVPGVHAVRYENLVAEPVSELQRLAEFLALTVPVDEMRRIVAAYQINRTVAKPQGLHYNKGVAGRYVEAFRPEDRVLSERYLGEFLGPMGYAH